MACLFSLLTLAAHLLLNSATEQPSLAWQEGRRMCRNRVLESQHSSRQVGQAVLLASSPLLLGSLLLSFPPWPGISLEDSGHW